MTKQLDPAGLRGRAMAATGLDDFGDLPLDDGLSALCDALREEAGLNASGVAAAEEDIVATLSHRLTVTKCLTDNPVILDEVVMPQIFVVGLPRSGTTALSQFLSEDPAARSVRRWEVGSLAPPPDAADDDDPRLSATRQRLAANVAHKPELVTMLPVRAEDPAEHGPILGLTFRNLQLPALYNVPGYAEWVLTHDIRPAYECLRSALKLLQWKSPAQHWNLKNPPDLFSLDAVDAVFPEATFVWIHRDPGVAIASLASLLELQRRGGVDGIDRRRLMESCLSLQAVGVERGLAARERIGERRFVDVREEDLERDPVALVRNLYSRLGLPFSPEFEASLRTRLTARPRGADGRHRYDVSDYGVTRDQIRERISGYVARFHV